MTESSVALGIFLASFGRGAALLWGSGNLFRFPFRPFGDVDACSADKRLGFLKTVGLAVASACYSVFHQPLSAVLFAGTVYIV